MIDFFCKHRKTVALGAATVLGGGVALSSFVLKHACPNMINLGDNLDELEKTVIFYFVTNTLGLATDALCTIGGSVITYYSLKAAINSRITQILANRGDIESRQDLENVLAQVINELTRLVAPGVAIHSVFAQQNTSSHHSNELIITANFADVAPPCYTKLYNYLCCKKPEEDGGASRFSTKFGIDKQFTGYVDPDVSGSHPTDRKPAGIDADFENRSITLTKPCLDKIFSYLNDANREAVKNVYYKLAAQHGIQDPRARVSHFAAQPRPSTSQGYIAPTVHTPLLQSTNGDQLAYNVMEFLHNQYISADVKVEANRYKRNALVLKIYNNSEYESDVIVNRLLGEEFGKRDGIQFCNALIIIPDQYFAEIQQNLSRQQNSYQIN